MSDTNEPFAVIETRDTALVSSESIQYALIDSGQQGPSGPPGRDAITPAGMLARIPANTTLTTEADYQHLVRRRFVVYGRHILYGALIVL